MAESKKRAADLEGTDQMKKPKFEKKSGPKSRTEKSKGGNPFQKTGIHTFFFLVKLCLHLVLTFNILIQEISNLASQTSSKSHKVNSRKQKASSKSRLQANLENPLMTHRNQRQHRKKLTGLNSSKRKKSCD